jgi:dolichyl-phosphate beta-glucosyltransferase
MNGYAFDVEALYLARKLDYRIREIGIHWNNSPTTKVSLLRHTLPMLLDVIRVRVNDWKNRYESASSNE